MGNEGWPRIKNPVTHDKDICRRRTVEVSRLGSPSIDQAYPAVFNNFKLDLLDSELANFRRLHGLSSWPTAVKERFLFDVIPLSSQSCRENNVRLFCTLGVRKMIGTPVTWHKHPFGKD